MTSDPTIPEGTEPSSAASAPTDGTIPPLRIRALRLIGPHREYNVDFTDESGVARQLSIIAGEISTGKTSILQFIDYCLGASEHPEHDEIVRNVRTARLSIEVREVDQATVGSIDPTGGEGETAHDQASAESQVADASDETANAMVTRYIIERPVGAVSKHGWLLRGDLDDTSDEPAEQLSLDPADPGSLSQFLLRACGLGGLRVKQAPTQAESATSILSFRDVKPLWFLTNRRMDNGDLVLENTPAKTLKLRQVVDYFFGVNDEESSAIAAQIDQLRKDLRASTAAVEALRKFLSDAGISDLATIDGEADRARVELAAARAELTSATSRLAARTDFADGLRVAYRQASDNARQTEVQLRDRQTLLRRLDPLRSQYADDLRKLEMLEESQLLFDPLSLTVCPACQHPFDEQLAIVDGHCSLCRLPFDEAHDHSDAPADAPPEPADDATNGDDDGFSVAREQRSVKRRLSQLKDFIADVTTEARELEVRLADDQLRVTTAQAAIDEATSATLAPFITERDTIAARAAASSARVDELGKVRRMLLQLQQRENHVVQTRSQLNQAVKRQRALEQSRQSRDEMIGELGRRFESTLADLGFPKLDQAMLRRNLVPVVRQRVYDRVGSSGAMTLIALAWQLSLYEETVEHGTGHPGFLLIDSPQKNLRRGSARSTQVTSEEGDDGVGAAIVANSERIVDRIYAHIQEWLAEHPEGQIIIVDNEPPERATEDVVVEYSADPSDPPYGLIDNEDGRVASDPEPPSQQS